MKNIITGLVVAIVTVVFSALLTNLLYQPKEIVKNGYKVDYTIKAKVKNIGGVSSGGLPELQSSVKEVDIEKLIGNADLKSGKKVFKKCAACHTIAAGEPNKIGPNLHGVIDRRKAFISGFKYSDAMKIKGGMWDYKSLNKFLTKPKDYIPGTKMAFPGLKKTNDRANVIAYLREQGK